MHTSASVLQEYFLVSDVMRIWLCILTDHNWRVIAETWLQQTWSVVIKSILFDPLVSISLQEYIFHREFQFFDLSLRAKENIFSTTQLQGKVYACSHWLYAQQGQASSCNKDRWTQVRMLISTTRILYKSHGWIYLLWEYDKKYSQVTLVTCVTSIGGSSKVLGWTVKREGRFMLVHWECLWGMSVFHFFITSFIYFKNCWCEGMTWKKQTNKTKLYCWSKVITHFQSQYHYQCQCHFKDSWSRSIRLCQMLIEWACILC